MRMFIAVASIASIIGCSGSSGNGSSSDAGSTSSSGGGSSGSCSTGPGTYMFHWTLASGGSMCQALPDATVPVDPSAGITMTPFGDGGGGCPAPTTSGCSSSFDCTMTNDAGFEQVSESFSVNADGSISGTLSLTISGSFGGMTVMSACTYTLTGTRQ